MSLLAIVLIFIIAALPILVLIVLFRWLSKKIGRKISWSLFCILVLGIGYEVYAAIYPNEGFYKTEFTMALKMPFPNSGKVVAKDASYPDTHGKYCSCSLIKTGSADFKKVLNHVMQQSQFKKETYEIQTDELQNVLNSSKGLDTNKSIRYYNRIEERNKSSVYFLKNGNEIVLLRCNF